MISGKVVYEASTEPGLQIVINQSREPIAVLLNGAAVTQKRTCDVNDLFKSYVCLYSNVRDPQNIASYYIVPINHNEDH